MLLDIGLRDLEKVLYFESYVVLEPGLTSLKLHELLTEEQYQRAMDDYGADAFRVGIGAEALKIMLSALNLEEMKVELRQDLLTS
ncbi:hypothetical protein ABTM52_19630, partial [Acinetobacter baumannii]